MAYFIQLLDCVHAPSGGWNVGRRILCVLLRLRKHQVRQDRPPKACYLGPGHYSPVRLLNLFVAKILIEHDAAG